MENDEVIETSGFDTAGKPPQKNNILKNFFKGVGIGSLYAGGGVFFILLNLLQFVFVAIAGLGMIVEAIYLFSKGSIVFGLLVLLIGTPLAIGFAGYLFPFLLILAILSAIIWGIVRIFGFSFSFSNAWDLTWLILKVLIIGAMAYIGILGFIEAIKKNRLLYFLKECWWGIILFSFLFWIFFF